MDKDGRFTGETVANLPSGQLPIRYTGAPLKDDNGNIVGAVEYVLDIAAEKQVTDRVTELAGQVASSSQQLNRAAEEAGKATGEIASSSQQVAKGADDQSRSIQDVTTSMGQLNQASQQVAKGAQEQANLVQQAWI